MLSKRVLDALREEFHEEFGELSVRDEYIQRMKADAFALICIGFYVYFGRKEKIRI